MGGKETATDVSLKLGTSVEASTSTLFALGSICKARVQVRFCDGGTRKKSPGCVKYKDHYTQNAHCMGHRSNGEERRRTRGKVP